MANESKYTQDRSIIYQETFNNEIAVRKNDNTFTNVSFENGVMTYKGSYYESNRSTFYFPKQYNLRKTPTGAGTLRIICSIDEYVAHSASNAPIFGSNASNNSWFFQFISPNKIKHYGRTAIDLPFDWELGRLYDFVFVNDNGIINTYVDGILYGSEATSDSRNIYKLGNQSIYGWNGSVDLIQIYNRGLSEEEISLLYNKQLYLEPPKINKGLPIFDGDGAYINMGKHTEYQLQNFEIEVRFKVSEHSQHIFNNINGNYGLSLTLLSDYRIRRQLGFGGGAQNRNTTFAYSVGDISTINYKFRNRVNETLTVDGIEIFNDVSSITSIDITWNTLSDLLLGNSSYRDIFFYIKYWELDTNGNRIKELIDLDFSQESGELVLNNADSAPSYIINGVVSGATLTTGRTGIINTAYDFGNTTDQYYIDLGVDEMLKPTNAITISAWLYIRQHGGWMPWVSTRTTDVWGGDPYLLWFDSTGDPELTITTTSTTRLQANGYPVPLNTWTHVVATYDGAYMKIYKNGILVASTPKTGTINYTNYDSTKIGAASHYSWYSGVIDSVRMWNRGISETEVQGLYLSDEVVRDGLVGEWLFEGDANNNARYGLVIPSGQTQNSWWFDYGGYKTIINLNAKEGIIQDRLGNSITNDGASIINNGSTRFKTIKTYSDNTFNINVPNLSVNYTRGWTILFWIKMNGEPINGAKILQHSTNMELRYVISGSRFQSYFWGSYRSSGDISSHFNKWLCVGITVNLSSGLQVYYYLNGVKSDGGNILVNPPTIVNENFGVGRDINCQYGDFNLIEGIPENEEKFMFTYYNSTKYQYLK